MKLLNNGNDKITKIIEKKRLDNSKKYVLSNNTFLFEYTDVYVIINLLTGQIFQLNEAEYKIISGIKDNKVSCEYIITNNLESLVQNRFIVESDYNDKEHYLSVSKMLKIMSGKKTGIKTYTILPTTSCNARCVYCYEKDYRIKNMTQQTADRIVEYIDETKCDGKIKLSWFGGEPLVGEKMISYICRGLREKNIEYTSSMISNGALFNKELAEEAKSLWNLKKVQIPLDGDRKAYEERKQYVNPAIHNYDTVIKNIKLLTENDIKVSLRCNYDKNNFAGLRSMVDDLSEHFSGNKNVSLYFHILFQNNNSDDYIGQITAIDEIYDYARAKGLKTSSKKQNGLKTNYCMADNMESSVVIDPEGDLYSCEHMPENGTWGNIFEGVTDQKRYEDLVAEKVIEKECEHCCFLPICTPFYKNGCPNSHKYCYEERKVALERQLRELIDDLKQKGEL